MNRWIPHPMLSAAMTLMWMMLTSFSLGHLILGVAISLIAGRSLALIEPERPKMDLRRLPVLARLVGIVFVDIIRSNIAVAWLVLTRDRRGTRNSDFLHIPLRIRNEAGLALLALIVTATPGTAWLEHDRETGVLLLHVFDLRDGDDWERTIRDRYEALLMEVFK